MFSEKAISLPRRSFSPANARCPSGWCWDAELKSCAPANPEALSSLTCGDNSVWPLSTLTCQRAASPSRRFPSSTPRGRHSLKAWTVNLCLAKLDASPILRAGDFSDFECVNPMHDLQQCGGIECRMYTSALFWFVDPSELVIYPKNHLVLSCA